MLIRPSGYGKPLLVEDGALDVYVYVSERIKKNMNEISHHWVSGKKGSSASAV